MPIDRWVVDATITPPPGWFCLVPVEGDINDNPTFVTGMNLLTRWPECGEVVAVIHEDGQEAVEAWLAKYGEELRKAQADAD